jgi:hypothetical protein
MISTSSKPFTTATFPDLVSSYIASFTTPSMN